jgi:hypothetical protein
MKMPKPSVKFAPVLLAGVLAAANLAAVTEVRAQAAADNCLTSPKAAAPAGSHWFYRIDRATNRQCWYLRDKDDKSARAAPQPSAATPSASTPSASTPSSSTPPVAQKPAPTQPGAITQKAISDARAEWLSQRARPDTNSSNGNSPANTEPRTVGAVTAPTARNGQPAAGANVLAPAPLAATRWPDVSGATASSNSGDTRTAAAEPPATTLQLSAEPQQPAAAPVAPAATDPSATKPTASLQMLFVVMAAALALAGITVSLIFRIGRARARAIMRRNRRTMWASAPVRRASPAPLRAEEARARPRRTEGAQHPRAAEHRERQMHDMLAQLARSAPR